MKVSVLLLTATAVHAQYTIKNQILDQTNKLRAAHGIPPITYDDTAAAGLQQWADSCPGFQRGGPSGSQNLAPFVPCGDVNQPACMSLAGAAWMWYDQEEALWNYDTNQCKSDNVNACGDFSNMLCRSVLSMACGWSSCTNGDYVWCNFDIPMINPSVPRNMVMSKDALRASLTPGAQSTPTVSGDVAVAKEVNHPGSTATAVQVALLVVGAALLLLALVVVVLRRKAMARSTTKLSAAAIDMEFTAVSTPTTNAHGGILKHF
ncbi:Aste57867_3540 [Aphanomyces stellatus]|uniref:Aste57867_3540 protein n=1 Tax=Aphanomyces stellatus TaxID=120398 RepID=A0A485KEC5_9STRA|nr:hypothetical protein As57867_003529 [Aphanomyces stellatus]VFT80703.1 Aste57867_3540 [Aphanomyces stellatus]